jgi:hypothetical protein
MSAFALGFALQLGAQVSGIEGAIRGPRNTDIRGGVSVNVKASRSSRSSHTRE